MRATNKAFNRSILLVALSGCLLSSFALQAQQPCDPLPAPAGPVIEVDPQDAGQLRNIVGGAAPGTTIRLSDGIYDLSGGDSSHRLNLTSPGLVLRSASGDRDAVVLDGGYTTNEVVAILASNVVIADLTIKRAFNHPIHITGTPGNPISGVLIHNVRVIDPGQQAIKINPNGDGYTDDGTIECSLIELTDQGRTQVRDNCYTGGIDAHQARGWVVRRNRIEGFWCSQGLSEHGVHFWTGSRDTLVEENVIVDCARGIGFGLGSSGTSRSYPDDPYPGVGYLGHIDGVIRNNFIAASDAGLFASNSGFDTGIGLEQAREVEVYHNSVASTQTPKSSSIEWRFGNTLAEIANNLASWILKPRDGAVANLTTNLENVSLAWFADVSSGDLHLTAAAKGALDGGAALPLGAADTDIDGDIRDDAPDVGADERFSRVFTDGFESGDTSSWSGSAPP